MLTEAVQKAGSRQAGRQAKCSLQDSKAVSRLTEPNRTQACRRSEALQAGMQARTCPVWQFSNCFEAVAFFMRAIPACKWVNVSYAW
jgi:hypothetical protein